SPGAGASSSPSGRGIRGREPGLSGIATSIGTRDMSSVESGRIRLVAGLGNPGPEYAATRHNIGFGVVDFLAAKSESTWEKSTKWDAATARSGDVLFAKPMSFMNRSGHPLFAIAQFYKIQPQEI